MLKTDLLIVGAGFSGLVVAERLASQYGLHSLVVERRRHIGGNAYDEYDDHGVLVHSYGPHYFRTNSDRIVEYLSQFTDWRPVEYQIRSWVDGRYWNFPINLNTFEQFQGRASSTEEFESWLAVNRIFVENPKNSEEVIVSQVGWELYRKFFEGYSLKQWKRHPRELDASVCGRIPIRTNRDDRYFNDRFQALPKAGYTRLFDRMVASCGGRVRLLLNTEYREILPHVSFRHMVYTGPIDEYFDHCDGHLAYRSLRFERESFAGDQLSARLAISGRRGFWQPALQVNYPNEFEFTRIVEVKHATAQQCENTTIVREYPDDFSPGKEPYYPVPAPDTAALYRKYLDRATAQPGVSFIGRLATYRYYNMDQVVGMALTEAEKIGASFAPGQ